RRAGPDQPRQEIGAAPVGVQAEPAEHEPEGSRGRCDSQVARERQAATGADGWTIDSSNGRLRHRIEQRYDLGAGLQQIADAVPIAFVNVPLHPVDIAASAE